MKNKQVVITLHEGCLDPSAPIILSQLRGSPLGQDGAIKQYLKERLNDEPDCILIDKVEVIDCDCDLEE